MKAKDVRKGTVIIYKDAPHKVIDFHHHTPGNLRALVQTKLRNVITGVQSEARFSSTEDLREADIYQYQANYLYSDSAGYHFMNTENYEEIVLSTELMGDSRLYLYDGMSVQIMAYNGDPVGLDLPKTVTLTIVDTPPELRGSTASNSPKPATTDTGLVVSVPPFFKNGDRIVVDTGTGNYISRGD